jgi:hypothetical protein
MTHLRTAVVVFAFTAAGCGEADWPSESVETEEAAITGGSLLTSAQHVAPHTSVIKIEVLLKRCTALKVGTNTFWTAAHCLPTSAAGQAIKLTNGRAGDLENPQYSTTIATANLHPSFNNYNLGIANGFSPMHYDIARFSLVDPTPAIPAYSTTDTAWVAGDQDVSFTAYGCDRLDESHSGRKQYATIHLATLGELAPGMTDYYAHKFISAQDVPQACPGDSGAPTFKNFGGTLKVVGTVVEGDAGFTGIVRYGNVRRWLANPAVNRFELGFQGFHFRRHGQPLRKLLRRPRARPRLPIVAARRLRSRGHVLSRQRLERKMSRYRVDARRVRLGSTNVQLDPARQQHSALAVHEHEPRRLPAPGQPANGSLHGSLEPRLDDVDHAPFRCLLVRRPDLAPPGVGDDALIALSLR